LKFYFFGGKGVEWVFGICIKICPHFSILVKIWS
jgi:hypothetical protein